MSAQSRLRRWISRLHPSRISVRLLAFNLLVLFLPVAGILYLDVYERELLAEQERGMVLEARAIAAGLGGSADLAADARRVILQVANHGSRVRVFDSTGSLLADSAGVGLPPSVPSPYSQEGDEVRSTVLYRLGAWLVDAAGALRRLGGRAESTPAPREPDRRISQELQLALAGKYGAATRPTPGQRSMTLTSAVPIKSSDAIAGAVTVSQTTYRTLSALYRIRFRLFTIILLSVGVATLLSLFVSATVVRPIDRLRESATSVSLRLSALTQPFAGLTRKDEVGDLSRALQELAHRLDAHITQVEAFAGDVAHEFRNPLAAIRLAAETVSTTDDPEVRAQFLSRLIADVDRLERLVASVRDLATLDAQIAQEPPARADVHAIVASVVEGLQIGGGVPVKLTAPDRPLTVTGSADRLAQVFENILANARSFSPAGAHVDVGIETTGTQVIVTVADRGPGIPAGHEHRIFERFFTFRPGEPAGRREHAGLGLAIAKAIVEGYGGTVSAKNRADGGAQFAVQMRRLTD